MILGIIGEFESSAGDEESRTPEIGIEQRSNLTVVDLFDGFVWDLLNLNEIRKLARLRVRERNDADHLAEIRDFPDEEDVLEDYRDDMLESLLD